MSVNTPSVLPSTCVRVCVRTNVSYQRHLPNAPKGLERRAQLLLRGAVAQPTDKHRGCRIAVNLLVSECIV